MTWGLMKSWNFYLTSMVSLEERSRMPIQLLVIQLLAAPLVTRREEVGWNGPLYIRAIRLLFFFLGVVGTALFSPAETLQT